MKFRLPFQIYRTGIISRSSSPEKILNKLSKDNEAKVRKKTSKINSSYRAIISNYIYRFTHLPLKITMSKLRNRNKLKSSTKSHKSKYRNEFVFLQEASKRSPSRKKAKNDKVTNEASDCCMNSTKCANFMCAKSTAKILLQQKDLLCNKSSNKSVTTNPEEMKPKEKKTKNVVTKSTNVQMKDKKSTNNATPPPVNKPVEMPIIEKQKPNEYKWKLNKSDTVVSNTELRRLKSRLHSSDKNRNYKIEEASQAPIRMDDVVGTSHLPKKLPELPVQIMPKIEQVRPKEAPSLVAPKRKYDAPEMTRNYKAVENMSHGPLRMDNLVGCKNPKDRSSEIKGLHENYTRQHTPNKSSQATEVKKDTIKDAKYYVYQTDHKLLPKNTNVSEMNKRNMVNDEKDAFLLKLDQVLNDLVPKNKKPTRNLQQLNTTNIKVSERIKQFENLIENNSDQHQSKSEGLKLRLLEERLLSQVKQSEKKDRSSILSTKLSPFAIAEIRRKYYPPDTFEKDKSRLTLPINTQMAFAVPLTEKNETRAEPKLNHVHWRPKEQYKNLNENILEINPTGNIKKKHTKIKKTLTYNSGVEKLKDVDNSNSDYLGECSTNSTIEASTINIIAPKVLIPPPSRGVTTPEIKPTSNLCYNDAPVERKISANIKKSGEVHSEVSRAKKRNRIESNNVPQDLETLKQDRKFSTDILTKNIEDISNNRRELDRCIISNSNSNKQHISQRNLSKGHCTIKVTSTLDNQDNTASSTGSSNKLTRNLSYQYYHEQCTISKKVNNYEMASINLPVNPLNAQRHSTIEINTDNLLTDERYNNMLNEKTILINHYIKWKMQFQKFRTSQKKLTEPSKSCLNFTTGIDKQNKHRISKYKITRRKQKTPSDINIPVRQKQNDSINDTVDLIKTQVAQKCVLFDKISDALLKKTDIINYGNHTNNEMQQKEEKLECFQNNRKRKLSLVPILDRSPRSKYAPVEEVKKPVQETKKSPVLETRNTIPVLETKNVSPLSPMNNEVQQKDEKMEYLQNNKKRKLSLVPILDSPPKKKYAPVPIPIQETRKSPVPETVLETTQLPDTNPFTLIPETNNFMPFTEETKNLDTVKKSESAVEYMEVDVPLVTQIKGVRSSTMEEDISIRRTCSRKYSFKLKGPKVPNKEASRLQLMHTSKIKPLAIPATMKAKKFLAKFEAGPDVIGNMLKKKANKKCQEL